MCIDEASRKNKFQLLAENQENKIKDYVLSLDILKTSRNNVVGIARSGFINATKQTVLSTLMSSTLKQNREIRSIINYSHVALPLLSSKFSKKIEAQKIATSEKSVECCDVKISYWFQEDNFQHLFFQILMLVLITSRWLITRAELKLNQRSLILVVSVATAVDTLDFLAI